MAAPPAYEDINDAPPSYPALQQQEPAPPPAAFGNPPPATVVIHDPSAKKSPQAPIGGGESYKDTAQRTAQATPAGGGGENNGQKQIIVYVQQNPYPAQLQHGNYNRQYEQPRSNSPQDLFLFKIRDQNVNAFGTGPNCVCCCHLQLAAYISLVLFLLFNGFGIQGRVRSGTIWDIIVAVYFAINIIINFICFMGIIRCKPNYIQPQTWVCLSYVIVPITDLILYVTIEEEELEMMQIFDLIVTFVFSLWFAWIFWRIYRWAYYFSKSGPYVPNMYKPPPKNTMVPQVQPAQAIQMQPIPQDGNLR